MTSPRADKAWLFRCSSFDESLFAPWHPSHRALSAMTETNIPTFKLVLGARDFVMVGFSVFWRDRRFSLIDPGYLFMYLYISNFSRRILHMWRLWPPIDIQLAMVEQEKLLLSRWASLQPLWPEIERWSEQHLSVIWLENSRRNTSVCSNHPISR